MEKSKGLHVLTTIYLINKMLEIKYTFKARFPYS